MPQRSLRSGRKREPFPLRVDLDAALRPEFLLAEDQMAEDEKAAFRPFDGDAPLHRRLVAGDGRGDRHRPPAQAIDPAAIAEAHLESGRHGQQSPSVSGLDEHAQAARAGDVVGIARDGKQLVEGRVADRELRPEHPMHPCGGAQNRLVGQDRLPAANERAVAPRHDALLLAQDNVAAVSPPRNEER